MGPGLESRPGKAANGIILLSSAIFQHFLQRTADIVQTVRFHKGCSESVLPVVGHYRIVGISAGFDKPGCRIQFKEGLCRLLASHPPPYGEVEDHRGRSFTLPDLVPIPLYQVLPAAVPLGVVPHQGQHLARDVTDVFFIIHYHDESLSDGNVPVNPEVIHPDRFTACRKEYFECGPFPRFGGNGNIAAVLSYYGIDRGESESGSGFLGREVGIEDFFRFSGVMPSP
jgi:hypothetical protein